LDDQDVGALFEKISQVVRGNDSRTVRMRELIDFCSARSPHPDWQRFSTLPFESDCESSKTWLKRALGWRAVALEFRGLWFGLANPERDGRATLDLYVGGSLEFSVDDMDWASELEMVSDDAYLNSAVLASIYEISYSSDGSLGNAAEYPLGLAYGCMVALDAVESGGAGIVKSGGAAAGFDSGDFLRLGIFSDGAFERSIE